MQLFEQNLLACLKSQPTFYPGRKSSIGTSAVQLQATSQSLQNGVIVVADSGNSGIVYVGPTNAVTAAAADATSGFKLAAGASAMIPVDDLNKVWLIASGSGQTVFFLGS